MNADQILKIKMQFWCDVYVAAVENQAHSPVVVADDALKEFDKTFEIFNN